MEINMPNVFESVQSSMERIKENISKIENRFEIQKFQDVLAQKIGFIQPYQETVGNSAVIDALKNMSMVTDIVDYTDIAGLIDLTNSPDENSSISDLNNIIAGDAFNSIDETNNVFENTMANINDFGSKLINGIKNSELFSKINEIVDEISAKNNVDPNLVKSVIKVESNFNPDATSHVGAMGLMQLMPKTASALGVSDPYDIYQNIDGGIRLIRTLLNSFSGNTKLALAAYNAGSKRVMDCGDVPPIPETQNYVRKVLELYNPELL